MLRFLKISSRFRRRWTSKSVTSRCSIAASVSLNIAQSNTHESLRIYFYAPPVINSWTQVEYRVYLKVRHFQSLSLHNSFPNVILIGKIMSSKINYAKAVGIESIGGAVIFAILYLPLFLWFVRKSFVHPTHVHYTLTLFCISKPKKTAVEICGAQCLSIFNL